MARSAAATASCRSRQARSPRSGAPRARYCCSSKRPSARTARILSDMRIVPSLRTIGLALLLAAGTAVVAPRAAPAKLRVITTIETFADLARQVGGDRVEVRALSRGYMDPHFVESKPSLVIELNRADLLVHVGLELEVGWLPPLVLGARNPKIQPGQPGNLDASARIPVLDVPATKVDRSLGDIHPQGNPHYWIPPGNAVIVAREIAERLSAIDPSGAAVYKANLERFTSELGRRRAEWEKRAAPLRGMKVVTYHRSWGYVSAWL